MTRLLYFPTIAVPKNAWLRRSLLYWDGISSMVPQDFWERPKKHDAGMLEMVKEGVVSQEPIYPNTRHLPNFESNFIRFLDLNPRRPVLDEAEFVNVHIEKLGYGRLGEIVQRKRLAKYDGGSWMRMEPQTADEFMAYLATCVANGTSERRFIAATDDVVALNRLQHGQSTSLKMTQRAIEALLPAPSEDVDLREIADFREANISTLDRLRSNVQRKIEKSIIASTERSDELFDLELEEMKEDAMRLANEMKAKKWGLISFGSLTGLGSAVLGAEPLLDGALTTVDGAVGLALLQATAATVAGMRGKPPASCMAYAAISEAQFA